MLKKSLSALALLLAGFLVYVGTRPDTYRVERSVVIAAPAERVFAHIEDLRAWAAWSPWEGRDPKLIKTFSDPAKGVGATYAWQGNDQVGKGKMTLVEARPPTQARLKLEFFEPFESVANAEFRLQRGGPNTKVSWSMNGENDFAGKLFGVFLDVDALIGADFDKGLAALKRVSERDAAGAGPSAP